ncbi:MAG: GHKL domain-containing protein [Oscillospiraceae bacterium]|nr:GHKL domain-containing protein [Oscillospiraceae bacterium]
MIIFLTIWIYNTTYKHMESLEENKQKDIMLEHWQSQYITAMNAQKVIVELNHNLQYHFLTLSCFLKKGKTEEAQKHIEKELGALDDITSTGNMPIDTMLNYYNHRARDELEIEIKTELAIPPDMHLDAVLVVTILGNALENAIEACHHLLLPERYIHVRASITESRALFIVITNPYALTPVADKNGRLLTSKGSKQLHGFGLSSIQEMFPEDAGQIYYEYKDNVFRFMFLNYNILDEKSTNVTSNLPNVTIVK